MANQKTPAKPTKGYTQSFCIPLKKNKLSASLAASDKFRETIASLSFFRILPTLRVCFFELFFTVSSRFTSTMGPA